MSLKGLVFIIIFFICVVGASFAPHLGIYGYLVDYCISPAQQWWGRPFANIGIRFSLILALATIVGVFLQRSKLNFGKSILYDQEKSLIFLLAVVWLLFFISPETVGRYGSVDHPSVKFTKVVIFILLMTHVLTDLKKLNGLFWVLSSVSLYLGFRAWQTPYGRFVGGRLEGIGGADFAEANFLAAFMAAMLPIIGIQFMKSKLWYGKVYFFLCAAFAANTLSLCRSRGAFVGLAAGAFVACFFAPKKIRKQVFVLMIIGALGMLYVSDDYFFKRISSISIDQGAMDSSSATRIEFWKAGYRMFMDKPLGVGPGNFFQTIGHYLPEAEGRDTHNTYIRCATELGFAGIFLLILLIWQSIKNLLRLHKTLITSHGESVTEYSFYLFSMIISMVIVLACGMTITMTYTEFFWLIVMLPVCLKRSFDNESINNSDDSNHVNYRF